MAEKINIIVTPEALEGLRVAIERVEKLKEFINDAGTPSGSKAYTESLKQQASETKNLTDKIIAQEKEERAKIATEKASLALAEAKIRASKREQKEIDDKSKAEQQAIDKNLKAEKQATQNEVAEVRKRLQLISSLNKQHYTEQQAQIVAHDKALLFSKEQELKQIRAVISMRQSLNAQRQKEIEDANKLAQAQAKIDAKNSRTGASSSIPSMGTKIADLREAERLALANEKLNRAYVQLTANREKAKNKLQDYIAEENRSTKEIKEAQKQFDILNKKVAAADKAVGRFSDANRKINGFAQGIGNLMGAFGIATGAYLAVDVVKGIYDTTKALQSLDLALKMVGGSEQEFAENKVFITEVANKWGLEVKSLQETYTQFYTASKGLLSDESIKTTFEGIAKAGSVMGLSLEKQQAAFYAIDQMMSKGTVTAEELKKQLGNAMPGAIKAAAMAYMELHPAIKTIQEAEEALYKDMKKGAIDSATYVPLIAKNFQILYGIEALEEVNTMQSAQNRLKNGYTEWIKELTSGNSVTNKAVTAVNWLAKNVGTLLNIILKGGTILGVYLGVTKAINFAMTQGVLITEAYAIAKSVLTTRLAQNTVAETANATAAAVQTTATVASTVATEGATVATNRFTLALLKNPIVAVIALLMAGVTAYLLLRDSTDDATASLLKYEQAKRDAEKQAVKDVKNISKDKNALQERLEIEVRQLKRLREIQKTVNGAELIEINDRIKAKETEIGLTKEKLRLEGINVKEKSKEASDTAYKTAHKIEAERDRIELERIKRQEQLDKAYEKRKNYDYSKSNEVKQNTKLITDLENELKIIDEKIKAKNVEIVKQNKIFNELRPDKVTKLAETPAEETKAEKKAREKAEKDRLKAIEDSLKLEYDLKMSNLERDKEIIKDLRDDKETSLEDMLFLNQAYSYKEVQIAIAVYDEKIRLAKGNDALEKIALNEKNTAIENAYAESLEKQQKIKEDYLKNEKDKTKEWYEKNPPFFIETQEQKEAREQTEKDRLDSIKAQEDAFKMFAGDFADKLGFSDTFDLLLKGKEGETLFDRLKKDEATWQDYALAITTVMQDAYNFINQQSQARFEAEYERLAQQKEVAIGYAGDSTAAKEKIELDYSKKKKEIENREAKAKKKQAIFNIAIDTAQAAMSSWAKTGFPWMAAAAIAMGAVQIAMVASQKIPEYWTGTDNAKEGLALTQERGAEIITDRKGKIKTFGSHKGAVLTRMQSGDKVYNAEESKRMMFENEYRLKSTTTNTNNGMTADEMRGIMVDTLGGRPTLNLSMDGNGLSMAMVKNGNITRQSESRGSGRGIEV